MQLSQKPAPHSTTVYVPSSELGLSQPLSRQRVRGWGSPYSDDWRKSLALCLLCDWPPPYWTDPGGAAAHGEHQVQGEGGGQSGRDGHPGHQQRGASGSHHGRTETEPRQDACQRIGHSYWLKKKD
jgi:hypothetical protein